MRTYPIILTLLAVFAFNTSNAQTFSGTYSVGGTGADYPTIMAAVNAMAGGVVAGAVIVEINSGVYEEFVDIPSFNGASNSNQVVFKSKSGNPEDVLIISDGRGKTGEESSVVRFKDSKFTSLSRVTIKHLVTSFPNDSKTGALVNFHNACVESSVIGCHLLFDSTVNSPRAVGIFMDAPTSGGVNSSNIRIIDNIISFGGELINLKGNALSSPGTGIIIRGNQILNSGWKSIISNNYNIAEISKNTIITQKGVNINHAIEIMNCRSDLKFENNYIKIGGYAGIEFTNIVAPNATSVKNNMIIRDEVTATSGRVDYGINVNACTNMNFYHNSMLYTGASQNSYLFAVQGNTTNLNLVNNNFSNQVGGLVYWIGAPNGITTASNNNLHTTGSTLATWSGSQATLADLQTATGKEQNSISTNPLFFSTKDLHIDNFLLDKVGTPLASVTLDYDGDPRDAATPDIGADEFEAKQFDLALVGVEALNKPEVGGLCTLAVKMLNLGASSLNGKEITLSISVDSGKTVFDSQTFLLEGLDVGADTFTYVFEKAWNVPFVNVYDLKASLSTRLAEDPVDSNEVIRSWVCTDFGGTYKLGKGDPSNIAFHHLEQLLSCGTITAPTTFTIDNKVHKLSKGLVFPLVNGIDKNKAITFTGPGEIRHTSIGGLFDHFVIKLDGAKHVTIKNLSIVNPNVDNNLYGSAIYLTNETDSITIDGNYLEVDSLTNASRKIPITLHGKDNFFHQQFSAKNTVISNNIIVGGGYGVRSYGANSTRNEGTVIRKNTIKHSFYRGIFIRNDNVKEIYGNTIALRDTGFITRSGISVTNALGEIKILNNKITNANGKGIELSNVKGIPEGIVANNMVTLGVDSVIDNYGIHLIDVDSFLIAHNAVLMQNQNTESSVFTLEGVSTSNNRILNNIFCHTGTGLAYFVINSSGIKESDHNNYYTKVDYLGFYDEEHNDLASLQNATGTDGNSIEIKPKFLSTTDLKPTEIQLDGAGVSLVDVGFDFYEKSRNSPPDIGAVEFSVGKNIAVTSQKFYPDTVFNATLDQGKEYAIITTVKNEGTSVIDGGWVRLSINEVLIDSVQLEAPLNSASEKVIVFEKQYTTPKSEDTLQISICIEALIENDIDLNNNSFCNTYKVIPAKNDTVISAVNELVAVEFSFYPNPTNGEVKVKTRNTEPASLKIHDSFGRFMRNIEFEKEILVNIQGFAPGVYFITVEQNNNVTTKKLIKY